MPNSPQPVTADTARRWTQARMPVWPPWLVVGLAVAGVVLSIATDHTVCTPKDPAPVAPTWRSPGLPRSWSPDS